MSGAQSEGLTAVMRRSGFAALVDCLALALLCATPAAASCAPKSFDGAKFTVCAFDPRHDDIRLFLSGRRRPALRLARRACRARCKAKGEQLAFAMNAGMFKEDQSPVGLYVEEPESCTRPTRAAARPIST